MYNLKNNINKMRTIITISILIFSCSIPTYAYPESQMEDCVSSALSNPASKSFSRNVITNYCANWTS